MIPRILWRRVPVECAASPRPAPHRTPDPNGTRAGTADAPQHRTGNPAALASAHRRSLPIPRSLPRAIR